MTERKLLQQALDALHPQANRAFQEATKDAIRAALAAPEPEPVAWRFKLDGDLQWQHTDKWQILPGFGKIEPLFTHPPAPQAPPVALTDDALLDKWAEIQAGDYQSLNSRIVQFARTLLAAPAPAVPEWRPIETAPKDGTIVLSVNMDGGISLQPSKHIHNMIAAAKEDAEPCWYTHWMPLPPAPDGITAHTKGTS
jgi:hypothetical protein